MLVQVTAQDSDTVPSISITLYNITHHNHIAHSAARSPSLQTLKLPDILSHLQNATTTTGTCPTANYSSYNRVTPKANGFKAYFRRPFFVSYFCIVLVSTTACKTVIASVSCVKLKLRAKGVSGKGLPERYSSTGIIRVHRLLVLLHVLGSWSINSPCTRDAGTKKM